MNVSTPLPPRAQLPQDQSVNSRLLLSQTATLSATEVALGSLVHGFKIPLGGHLLSLNQGLILTWCVRRLRARVASVQAINSISLTSGALKALSPMGNRLGPMLAISMQGLLYSCGVLLLGANFAGALAGMFLLALWGVLQPVLVAWLLFGRSVFDGLLKLWGDIASLLGMSEEILWPVLAGFVGLKVLAGWLAAGVAWRLGPQGEQAYIEKLDGWVSRSRVTPVGRGTGLDGQSPPSVWRGVLGDLLSPWFLAGVVLSLSFFAGTGEHGAPEIAFQILRVFGVSILFFWSVRAIPESFWRRLFKRWPGLLNRLAEVRALLGN
jgi:hypothetical protein